MFAWLFGFKSMPIAPHRETSFSNLPVGQEFTKNGEDVVYVKVNDEEFETANNSYHPIKWYRVHEDFTVRT